MTQRMTAVVVAGALLLAARSVGAQEDRRNIDSQHGTALSLFGGAASGSSGTGGALGWAIGWAVTPRIEVEGSGWWTAEPSLEGFAALVGPRFSLTSLRTAMPFVSAEVGMFHATVDALEPDLPSFYLERMVGGPSRRTFDDFAMAAGGGVDIYLKRRVSLRPHVRVLMVTGDSSHRLMAVYGVHVSYSFAEEPVTP